MPRRAATCFGGHFLGLSGLALCRLHLARKDRERGTGQWQKAKSADIEAGNATPMEKSMANPCVNGKKSSVPWCRRSHLFSHFVMEIPSQIAKKARHHDAVHDTCYLTDLWTFLQKWCHDAVECHDAVDDIIWNRGAPTHFSGRDTLSATLHSTDSSYHSEKVEKCHSSWNQKKNAVRKESRCVMHGQFL